jgi:hypothetical protein
MFFGMDGIEDRLGRSGKNFQFFLSLSFFDNLVRMNAMTIKLLGIGGMGLMLSPSAKHLKPEGAARFLRLHDRGTKDDRVAGPWCRSGA